MLHISSKKTRCIGISEGNFWLFTLTSYNSLLNYVRRRASIDNTRVVIQPIGWKKKVAVFTGGHNFLKQTLKWIFKKKRKKKAFQFTPPLLYLFSIRSEWKILSKLGVWLAAHNKPLPLCVLFTIRIFPLNTGSTTQELLDNAVNVIISSFCFLPYRLNIFLA